MVLVRAKECMNGSWSLVKVKGSRRQKDKKNIIYTSTLNMYYNFNTSCLINQSIKALDAKIKSILRLNIDGKQSNSKSKIIYLWSFVFLYRGILQTYTK